MSFSDKVQVLDKSERGMKTAAFRCHYDVNKLMTYFVN
jgi:hypothetical protein